MASLNEILALTRAYNKNDASDYISWQKSGSNRFKISDAGDIYFSPDANHIIYGNTATSDATERSITIKVLDGTANSFLSMITFTPNAAVPTMDFNSRTISNATLSSPTINGTVATAGLTMPAFTLGGAVTGGNQNLTQLGQLGLANTAVGAYNVLNYSKSVAAAAANWTGLLAALTFTGTSGDRNHNGVGIEAYNSCSDASSGIVWGLDSLCENNVAQNMTNAFALVGLSGKAIHNANGGTTTGAAALYARQWGSGTLGGTLTNGYGIYITSPIVTGTVTNAYGLYINTITGAGTLNYAIYSVGGKNYFGGLVIFNPLSLPTSLAEGSIWYGSTPDRLLYKDATTDVKTVAILTTTASDNLKNSNDTEKTTSALVYTKIKEILINESLDSVRIKFDLKTAGGGATAYGKIYKNGVAVGSEQTDVTGGYVTKSEDLTSFVAGDLIQIYAYTSNAGQAAYVQNFRLYYDIAIDTTALSVTNQDP